MLGSRVSLIARVVAFTLAAVLGISNIALADTLWADGDGVTPVENDATLAFGSVCKNVSSSKPVLLAVRASGHPGAGTNVYANGATVSMSVLATSGTGVGGDATDASIELPDDWTALGNGAMSNATSVSVSVNRSTTGAFTGSVTFRASGERSNDSSSTLTRDVVVGVSGTVNECDTTPPDTSIMPPTPANPTNSTAATFTYTSTESGSSFQCKLDAAAFAACPAGTNSYSSLGEAVHTFSVRAVDAAGNIDPTPASYSWAIDLTAPVTTITSGPDALTSSTNASFTFTSTESGSSFQCKLDAGAFGACPSSVPNYSGLGEGSHTFSVYAIDAAGNTDATPASHSWTIDLTPPAVSVPDLDAASDSGASAIDDTTSDDTPTLNGSAEAGSALELLNGADVVYSTTVGESGMSSFTTASLADGSHTFRARATDAAGNAATSAGLTVLIDRTAPSVSAAATKPDGSTYTAGSWTNESVTVSFSCSDAGSGVQSFSDPVVISAEGADQYASGSCTDVAGNTGDATFTNIDIDTTAPAASASAISGGAPYVAGIWTNQDVTVTFACEDSLSGVASLVPAETTLSDSAADQSASATCTDNAGNTGGASFTNIDIDKIAPVASASAMSGGVPYVSGTWTNQDVTVTFACEDLLSGVASLVPAETTLSDSAADQSASATCTDNAGNTGGASFTNIDIDKIAPVASASAMSGGVPYVSGTWTNQDVTVTFACEDLLSGVASLVPAETTLSDSAADQSASATCTDNAGNTDDASFTGINIDKIAPVASASATKGDGSPYVSGTWTNQDVTVAFDCEDALSGVSSLVPDAVTLSDNAAGQWASATCTDNAGNTDDASFTGINIDKIAPTIVLQSRTPAANAFGWNNSAVTVTWSCWDGLSGAMAASVSDTKTLHGSGQTASGMCADAAGNTASASVPGINIDLIDPHSIEWIGGPGAGATYYYGFLPAGPTCSAQDALSGIDSCSVSGYSSAVGSHTMRATALDRAGNDWYVERSFSVRAWNLTGFYSPVDMGGVWNTVRGGSTVPLKWEMFAGATEMTDPAAVTMSAKQVGCIGGSEDAVETLSSTGGTTSPRYDSTAGQFIYNWQTPKKPGTCYEVTMTAGGTFITARFKVK